MFVIDSECKRGVVYIVGKTNFALCYRDSFLTCPIDDIPTEFYGIDEQYDLDGIEQEIMDIYEIVKWLKRNHRNYHEVLLG